MNILLINTNPVVSRLVSLCMRDTSITFEEVDLIAEVSGTYYDIVFVDDASYHDEVAAFLSAIDIAKVVFLSSRDTGEEIGSMFDTVIKKPFLPSQIQAVLDSFKNEETDLLSKKENEAEESFIFPLSSDEEISEEEGKIIKENAETSVEEEKGKAPKVLDSRDIEQIKALLEEDEDEVLPLIDLEDEAEYEARKVEVITQKLEEDGLEIVREDEIIKALSQKPKKKKEKSKKIGKKKKKEEAYTFEEALLAAIEGMKPKKIKKLLRGAEVTIKIRFKDEE
ncbi:hypothetical protein ACM66Z_01235 [Sulfurovum sp. ST-21]|uniref:Response regulatory domain-containing protein n=1 Tax=Sulfurovum indicum TaxID=2779528 RepID=A0A7M1S701_9BACT|nr:hypothetical protein [Sulfurovum indicum]QOR62130.1 hypothetical protein IMZ28_01225 [Sulfurovum indicum]